MAELVKSLLENLHEKYQIEETSKSRKKEGDKFRRQCAVTAAAEKKKEKCERRERKTDVEGQGAVGVLTTLLLMSCHVHVRSHSVMMDGGIRHGFLV